MKTAPVLLIQKKRDGKELTREEISDLISGISTGELTDYQASAFLMATYFKGMTLNETVALTEAMLASGERYDLSSVPGKKVDKHSTGGVGDKVSLILGPLAAACGVKVPMMAGRGLGHSGGTIDKLEAISGFKTTLTKNEFLKQLRELGCVIIGQSSTIAPADKKLYALRDVTATVDCIPLIVGSILSKKLAEGTEALVLDVKVGNGAFMQNVGQARKLAKALTQVAKKMKIKCRAVLSNMDQPLGYLVGNSLEVIESIEVLRGESLSYLEGSSSDLKELTLQLCAHMIELCGVKKSLPEARKLATQKLQDGSAYAKFLEMVEAQGGDINQIKQIEKLPLSKKKVVLKSAKKGTLTEFQTEEIGRILIELGGGRKKVSDLIDFTTGFAFHKKLGARVKIGEPLATIFLPEKCSPAFEKEIEAKLATCIKISSAHKPVPKLILDTMQ